MAASVAMKDRMVRTRPPGRRRCLRVGLGIALASTFACTGDRRPVAPAEEEARARRQVFSDQHLLTGELSARRAVEITAPDVGIRPLEIRWMIENGTLVAAGELLFEFDNTGLASRLQEHHATVLEARTEIASIQSKSGSNVAEAEFALKRRRAELERARIDADIPPGLHSAEEDERLRLELQLAERRFADAERLLATARGTARAEVEKEQLKVGKEEAELRQVEGDIAQLDVTAPMAGVVLIARNGEQDRSWEVGDVVYPGHLLAVVPDLSTMIVRARLFDVDDGLVAAGMPALVTLDAHPGIEFRGRVRSIDRMAFELDRDSATRVFWVNVDLESLDLERMRPGMSARIAVERELTASAGPGGVVVPRSSLDLSDLAAPRVLLSDGSWRAIELGACSPLDCVVEAGLDEGVALRRVGAASEGS